MEKHAKNILQLDKFHNIKCKAYTHARFNISKGIIRSRELSLATPEEIEIALQKQGVKGNIRESPSEETMK